MYDTRRKSGICPGRENKIKKDARGRPLPSIVATLVALCAVASFSLTPAAAEVLRGRVVGVADGDTLTVLTAEKRRERVRLAGVDAPESKQAYGAAAKRRLSALVYGGEVTVEYAKRDRYGRIVGRVLRDANDAGLALLASGHAWHYLRYAREQSDVERAAYATAEGQARAARRGLWADPAPIAPWDWRVQQRTRPPLAAAPEPRAARLSSPQ